MTDNFASSRRDQFLLSCVLDCLDRPFGTLFQFELVCTLISSSLTISWPHYLRKLEPCVVDCHQGFVLCLHVQVSFLSTNIFWPCFDCLRSPPLYLLIFKTIDLALRSLTFKDALDSSLNLLVSFHLEFSRLSWWLFPFPHFMFNLVLKVLTCFYRNRLIIHCGRRWLDHLFLKIKFKS